MILYSMYKVRPLDLFFRPHHHQNTVASLSSTLPAHIPRTLNMGPRQNRKRIRHRPSRAKKQELQPSPFQPGPLLSGSQPLAPTRTIRWSYAEAARAASIIISPSWSSTRRTLQANTTTKGFRESAEARELRIFGGEEGERGGKELCGPMLDVVLGLFNGIDYEDVV